MKELTTEKVMTVKEVACVFNVTEEALKRHIRVLFPKKMENGKKTYLTEKEVLLIKQKMIPTTQVVANKTKLEQDMLIMQAMQILVERSTELENENKRLEGEVAENNKTINRLVHTNKIYSATEIAKEIGFRSATALNNDLSQKGIQFKQNGTWVLYSNYSNLGYTEIKQTVLDNGTIVYNRMFTGSGRKWLLKLYDVQ